MKKIVYIIFLSFIFSNTTTTNFKVSGMMCGVGCVKNITNNTMKINGVKECIINYEKESMEIIFDSNIVNKEKIKDELHNTTNYLFSIKKEDSNRFSNFWNNLFN
jgi:copper chaperone CopZ